jgi:hypothetical protein
MSEKSENEPVTAMIEDTSMLEAEHEQSIKDALRNNFGSLAWCRNISDNTCKRHADGYQVVTRFSLVSCGATMVLQAL